MQPSSKIWPTVSLIPIQGISKLIEKYTPLRPSDFLTCTRRQLDHIAPVTLGSGEGSAGELTGHTERLELQDVHSVVVPREYTLSHQECIFLGIDRLQWWCNRTCGGPSGR